MSKTRYASLDTFKTVSALLVVCLHAKLPDNHFADIILVLARIAVPYFFLCSGFFAYRDWDICAETRKKRLHTLLRHILILFGVIIIYVIANRFILKRSIPNIIKILSSKRFLLANFGIAGHMWFMRALIYMELLVLLFERFLKNNRFLKYFLVLLWVGDVVICKYSKLFFGHHLLDGSQNELVTKFIGTAVLYYFIGWEFRRGEVKIRQWVQNKTRTLFIFATAFLGLTVIEYFIAEHYKVNRTPVNFIFTLCSLMAIFTLLICHPSFSSGSRLNYIGSKLTMYVYYWHMIIIYISAKFAGRYNISKLILVNPLFIFLITIAIFYVYIKSKEKIQELLH